MIEQKRAVERENNAAALCLGCKVDGEGIVERRLEVIGSVCREDRVTYYGHYHPP